VGDIARSRGDLKGAEAAAHEYKRLALKLIAIDPTNPEWQMEGVYADTDLGVILMDEGRYSEAGGVFANALADRERLVAAYPANEQYRKAVSEVLAWLSEARENEGRLDDALAQRERQISMLEPIIARPDSDVDYRRQAMVAYRTMGRLDALRGDVTGGASQLQKSIDVGERLLQAEPANTEWMWLLARSKFDLARINLARGNADGAAALVRSGCDTIERLLAKDSSVVDWRVRGRGDCLELTTRSALAHGVLAEAESDAAQMVEAARLEVSRSGSNDAKLGLVTAYMLSAIVARSEGRVAESSREFAQAAAAWPKAMPDKPAVLAKKVVVLQGVGRSEDARRLAARLTAIGYREPTYLKDARAVGVK
jgi:tetratricopeptide (TPR) repeat protein